MPSTVAVRQVGCRRVDRARASSIQRSDVDADRDVQRVGVRGQRLVEPAARQVQRVARAQRHVEDGLAGRAGRAVALVLERQDEHGVVDEPPLLPRHLEREHLVRIVVHGSLATLAA